MATTPANVEAIAALRARGMSYRAIDRALGFAGSGRGVKAAAESKPAVNLTAALQALVRGESVGAVERRAQRVREPVVAVGEARSVAAAPKAKGPLELIRQAARRGQQVSLSLTARALEKYGLRRGPGELQLFGKGGWSAANVLGEIEQHPTLAAGLKALALARPDVDYIAGITRVRVSVLG